MKNLSNNVKGITLVSLILTIIILLILASIATYSGIDVIKSSKFTKFTTEMKIMQTQVNALYEKYKNGDTEILNLGKDLNEQADIVFTSDTSGITDQTGYKYFDRATIEVLNIEGVEEEFFINVETRSVVSYEGFEYEGVTYYTLEQLPNGLYNVEYNENTNTGSPTFNTDVEKIGDNKWRITVSNIQYSGYIDKWEVKYRLSSQENCNTSKDLSFVVTEQGKYIIELVNGNIKSEDKKVIIGQSDNLLPDEYQEVEYIRSTGTQYINTGLYPNNTMKVEIDTVSKNNVSVFGGDGSTTTNTLFNLTANNTRSFRYGTTKWDNSGYSFSERAYIVFGRELYLNKELIYTFPETTFKGNHNLILFGRFNNSNVLNDAGNVTIYSCKIYDNDELVRDFIPCYEKQSEEIGLYDIVNDVFYKNEGTGVFEAGPVKNDNLSNYQQVEYIESTGTQYINTNFIPSGNKLRVVTNFLYPREHASLALFGNSYTNPFYLTVYGSVPTFWVGNSRNMSCGIQTSLNTKYTLDVEVNDGTLTTIWNGEKFTTNYSGDLNKEYEYYIFGDNNKGVSADKDKGYRLYDLKIYENDVLVRDYVPYYRKIGGEIGLFDKVNNKFYTNQGTGTFEKGTDVN